MFSPLLGELRNGDRPDRKEIARHLQSAIAALPKGVEKIYARADSGFFCWHAVQAYQKAQVQFVIVARKTSRLLEQLYSADWKPSPKTDADQQCEFRYQPEGWGQAYRFVVLRYKKKEKSSPQREQYQLFDTPEYTDRVFVTDMDRAIELVIWFYSQRAGAENLINDDSAENCAGARAPSCFKVRKSSRTGRSRRRGLSFPDRGQVVFPGCAARAALKATLEKGPTERWIIGSNDLATIREPRADFRLPRLPAVATLRTFTPIQTATISSTW
jgi:hypothetical protein